MGNYYQPFSLRIPEEIIDKMKEIATQNKRSANKEMEYALQQYIDAWEANVGNARVLQTNTTKKESES